jgi:pyrimidine deaminase RibD-like protein
LGVAQSELALSLINARNSSASLRALAGLVRFKLDGGLAEDYACALIRKRSMVKKYVVTLEPKALRGQCVKEYLLITRAKRSIFAASDADLLCRSESEIALQKNQLTTIVGSSGSCP